MEKTELIENNATLYDVIDLLRHSPKVEAKDIIEDISQESIERIIRNTLADDRPLSLIRPGLRALKTKGLLDPLDIKTGAAHYLNLLESKGTFLELIHILQYSHEPLKKDLMKNLSRDLTGRLVDRTVAEKCPINSLRRELNLLKRLCGGFNHEFQEKIGIDNVLKLIFNNGNLGILSEAAVHFARQEISQLKLFETFNALPADKKEEFILRGDFFKYCTALAECRQLDIFDDTQNDFSGSKLPVIDRLIRQSTYKSINRGLGAISSLPNKGLKLSLFKLVSDYSEKIKAAALKVESASEKIASLSILNRLDRLDKRSIEEIAGSIDEEQFLGEKDFIGSLQLLQFTLVGNETELWLRDGILKLSNSNKIINKIEKETPLNTFLYLWNTYALFTQEDLEDFYDWLSPGIVGAVYKVVAKHKKTTGNVDVTRHLLMLIGLLDYLRIETHRIDRIFPNGFRLLNMSKSFLGRVLRKVTFIPGYFYLRGIDLFAKKQLFPNKWKILIPRLFDLNLKTKGVKQLVESFQRKIKKRILPS